MASTLQIEETSQSTSNPTFQVRTSRLEYDNKQEYRGWFNLIILGFTTFVVSTVASNAFEKRPPLDGWLFYALSKGLISLLPAVCFMIAYSASAFFLQKSITAGWLHSDSYISHILQHVLQSFLFVYAIVVVYHINWPFVQSATFVLEMLVLFMKMHSYIMTNRVLALRYEEKIKKGTLSPQEKTSPTFYPNNCTFVNYVDYMLVPTLIYETYYPRTHVIRCGYVFEKIIATFATLVCLYTNTSYHILPVLSQLNSYSTLHVIFKLMTPFTVNYLLMFYLIFECICNAFAELTRFADREFYQDWWNSVTFDEYARKWNKPVHEFLKRHIYTYTKEKMKNKTTAMIATFLFSALLHELVLISSFRMIRPFLLLMMMMQIPLIYLGSLPLVKRIPRVGNFVFWFGMGLGPSMLAIMYTREYLLLWPSFGDQFAR